MSVGVTQLRTASFRFELQVVTLGCGPVSLQVHSATSFERTAAAPGDLRHLAALPLGAGVWPSGVGLLAELTDHAALLPGCDVLELGSGAGAAAVLAALLGARVTSVDAQADLAPLVALNAQANGVAVDHRTLDVMAAPLGLTADLVMAADCLYEPAAVTPMADAMAAAVRPLGRGVLVCPGRGHVPRFLRKMEARGFRCVHTLRTLDSNHPRGCAPLLAAHPPSTRPLEVVWMSRG